MEKHAEPEKSLGDKEFQEKELHEKPAPAASEDISGDSSVNKEDGPDPINDNYLSGLRLAVVMFALCISNFLVALDTTILATAVPKISSDFNSLQDVGWYTSSYLLTNCAFQLFYGKLYTRFKVKIVFTVAMIIFEIGSLLCGVAPNSPVFIFGRAIAGLGSAGAFSGALIIVIHSVQAEKRAQYSGMIVGMYGLASVAAPLIGGAFTDHVTWRWCFYINLPCGGVAIAGLLFFFHSPPQAAVKETAAGLWAKIAKFDPFGTFFFLCSMICLLLALQMGGSTYPFTDARIIVLLVLFGLLLVAFIVVQFFDKNATIPPRVMKNRSVAFGMIYMFCVGAQFLVLVTFMPIWFQGVRAMSATDSGIRSLPILLSNTFCVVLAGALVSMTGYYIPFMWASVVLTSIGAGLLTTLTVDASTGKWVGYQIIAGIGGGLGYQQGISVAQTVLKGSDMTIGTAVMVFVQLLGGTILVSAANNILVTRLVENLERLAPHINPEIILRAGASGIKTAVSEADYPFVIEAYNIALTKTFQIALIVSCLGAIGAAGVEWKRGSKKGDSDEPAIMAV
uniref:Efflux pump hmp6 n=1 Tax=Hypomyces subiculosus TaxID=193393 RepID=HPM6_HYPSB|nr:RecName: Full=Efflux pump hmp6; AltName: Full=Hypothemycin biosynthesis cluster protein hpm6 [Hypomyces subiculosus]ACD39756.1 major facilitator superfamily transporter [Hypomyces subiculosus]ACD39765.1 major facilitator superfamily transporter [Hypomyces subiculosus]